jgi:opacity protein-like surface antigen
MSRQINKHSVGIGLGQTFLFSDLEESGDNKITAELFYAYSASYSFDLLLNFHTSSHSYKDEEVSLMGLGASIKGKYFEFDAFAPYILGGLGFYRPRIKKDNEWSEGKNTFGFNLGAGVDLQLNKNVIVGLLAQYHNPFDVKQDDVKDVRGSYAKLLITAMYQF